MLVIKMPETDVTAIAEGCFDLPMVQAVDIKTEQLPSGDSVDRSTVRLITHWVFTDEEWEKLSKQEVKGVYLHVCAAITPPVFIDIHEPFTTYADIVPLKQHLKNMRQD